MTAFSAARCKYPAAISGFHTLAETMYCFAAAAVRLICTFHNSLFLLPLFQGSAKVSGIFKIPKRKFQFGGEGAKVGNV
jgi:hypothetical protein